MPESLTVADGTAEAVPFDRALRSHPWRHAFPGEASVSHDYFLNRFSNAWRAVCGVAAAGVEVSFSTRTRME